MRLLFSRTPVRHEDVHQAMLALGATRTVHNPLLGSQKVSDWRRGEVIVSLCTDLNNGLAILSLRDDSDGAVTEALQKTGDWQSGARLQEELAQQTTPGAQFLEASTLGMIGRFVQVDPTLDQEAITRRLSALATSESTPVQHEALRNIFRLGWPAFGGLVREVASQQRELRWLVATWSEAQESQRIAQEAAATQQARAARLAALPALREARRWEEAIAAARGFLDSTEEPEKQAAYHTLALSYQGLGEPLPAILWGSAWRSSLPRHQREEAEALLLTLGASLTTPLRLELGLLRELQGQTDEAELGEGLGLALQQAPIQHTELMLTAALLLQKSITGESATLLSLLGPLLAASSSPRVWLAYGQARAAESDKSSAEKAYRRALALIEANAESEQERLAAALEGTRDPSVTQVYARLRGLYKKSFQELYRITTEELTRPAPEEVSARLAAHLDYALSCTFTQRHEEAIAAYRRSIAMREEAGLKPEALLHFNLSCELAKQGEHEAALHELSLAAALGGAAGASDDEYFEALWSDPRFFVASVHFEEPPTEFEVRQDLDRAAGCFYRGDHKRARIAGHRAVAGAAHRKDDALLSKALCVHGNAMTYLTTPARGVRLLEQAVRLADEAPHVTPGARAEAHHMLGAGYHAARRFEEAEAKYQHALTQRLAAFGEKAPILAKSYGDLARLASDRAQLAEAEALGEKAITLLQELLPTTRDADEQLEMLSDLALLAGNQTALAQEREQDAEAIIARAEETTRWLTRLEAINAAIPGGLLERLRRVLLPYYKNKLPEAQQKRIAAIAARLAEVEEPNARVRDEKRYWLGLELGVLSLKERGVTEQEIAQAMRLALRGERPGGLIGEHPAFQDLSVQFAKRLRQRTDLVMIAMSLDLAVSGATSVLEAIRSLQEFAVGHILEETSPEPPEDEEETQDEDEDDLGSFDEQDLDDEDDL